MKTKLLIITLFVVGGGLRADETPIQLSLVPDIALFPSTTRVQGLSLSIWGQNPQSSLTLGIVNGSTGDSCGLSVGVFNYAESYHGVQWGAFNLCTENFVGWQHGYVNLSQGNFTGFQLGLLNVGENTTGFQLGALNYAQRLHGLQIGFVSIAANNPCFEALPNKLAVAFPFLNWSF